MFRLSDFAEKVCLFPDMCAVCDLNNGDVHRYRAGGGPDSTQRTGIQPNKPESHDVSVKY